jgi:hypothetical protein
MDDNELQRSLGRIEGKLEGILDEQRRLAGYVADTSLRVRVVEQEQSRSKGWAAGIGATASAGVVALWHWIQQQFGL